MLKLEPNVCLLEPDANVDAIYARTRILLAPSLWAEAFGLVVVEAALRGIPCITSDAGGLPEANPLPHLVVRTPLNGLASGSPPASDVMHGCPAGPPPLPRAQNASAQTI